MSIPPHVDDFPLVTLAGLVEEGQLLASVSEVVGMHAAVYRARAVVSAIVSTHSPAVTAFALAHRAMPCRYDARLPHGHADPVPVVAWAPGCSATLFESITEALDRHPATSALLLANHGLLAFGTTTQRAALLVIALEKAGSADLAAGSMGGSMGGSKPFPRSSPGGRGASMTGSAGGQPAGTAAGRS